jgi:hypothetical protein
MLRTIVLSGLIRTGKLQWKNKAGKKLAKGFASVL